MRDHMEGKISGDAAVYALMWLDRVVSIPESAMSQARAVVERAMEVESLGHSPIPLEDDIPSHLL